MVRMMAMPTAWFRWGQASKETTTSVRPRGRRWFGSSRLSLKRSCTKKRSRRSHAERYADKLVKRLSKRLHLNNEQQADLYRLRAALLAVQFELHEKRATRNTQLVTLLEAPRLDQKAAMAVVQDSTRAIDERAAELIMAFGDFADSLDAEQRQVLQKMLTRAIG